MNGRMWRGRRRVLCFFALSVLTCLATLTCLAMIWAEPAWAELRGLAIGINRYDHKPDLLGAVNDARDIARALRSAGAGDVTVLLDHRASFSAIRRAWYALVDRAQKGDTLVLTYSGHGGQTPELVPGSEADGKDENFFLSGYNEHPSRAARERIVDNEMHLWLKRAADKGLRVLFVADACHSGTMTRSVDGRAGTRAKNLPYGEPEDDIALFEDARAGARLGLGALPGVTFLAAAEEDKRVAEEKIDGKPRGLLSWAFARAIAGGRDNGADRGADKNGDGVLTRLELERFVLEAVRMHSDHAQEIDILPRLRSGDKAAGADPGGGAALATTPLLALPGAGGVAGAEGVDAAPTLPTLSLRILKLDRAAASRLLRDLHGARLLAEKNTAADLVWDAARREVVNGRGDVVAVGVDPLALQGVIDKWRALAPLRRMALGRTLTTRLSPDDGRHIAGAKLGLATDPVPYTHLLLLNLEAQGRVAILYPWRKNERAQWVAGRPFSLRDIVVQPPFGADHIVLVSASRPLDRLLRQLRLAGAADLPRLLHGALQGGDWALGLHGLFTRAKEEK